MCDNTSTIKIAENEKAAKRTRHLGAQIHYPKEQVEKGVVKIDFVPGKEQLADIMTKPLGPQKFIPNRDQLMTKLIITSISVLCLINLVSTYRFQTTDPIIYQVTDHVVADEIVEYIIDFTELNPCTYIGKADESFISVLNGEYHRQTDLIESCQQISNTEWLKLEMEIPNLHNPHQHYVAAVKRIYKRGIIGDLIVGGAGFTLGICTSNMFQSVLNLLGYKDATTQQLEDQGIHLHRID